MMAIHSVFFKMLNCFFQLQKCFAHSFIFFFSFHHSFLFPYVLGLSHSLLFISPPFPPLSLFVHSFLFNILAISSQLFPFFSSLSSSLILYLRSFSFSVHFLSYIFFLYHIFTFSIACVFTFFFFFPSYSSSSHRPILYSFIPSPFYLFLFCFVLLFLSLPPCFLSLHLLFSLFLYISSSVLIPIPFHPHSPFIRLH